MLLLIIPVLSSAQFSGNRLQSPRLVTIRWSIARQTFVSASGGRRDAQTPIFSLSQRFGAVGGAAPSSQSKELGSFSCSGVLPALERIQNVRGSIYICVIFKKGCPTSSSSARTPLRLPVRFGPCVARLVRSVLEHAKKRPTFPVPLHHAYYVEVIERSNHDTRHVNMRKPTR
jgi:hypothetical protein